MNTLFLFFAYPEMESSYNMYTTLVEQFVQNGHSISVVAPGSGKTGIFIERGIEVLRVKTLPIKNVSSITKGISNVLLPYQFGKAIKKYFGKKHYDLVISATPPVTLVDLIYSIRLKYGAKFYLILRDIFPQNAVDLGMISKTSIIYWHFKRRENRLYKIANWIGCMSEGNIKYLKANNSDINHEGLHILRNFQKKFDRKIIREEILDDLGLRGKYITVFGGNMGKPQEMENVLELAFRCREYRDVVFLLIGEGTEIGNIRKKVVNENIENILVIDTMPKDTYQDLLRLSDVGLISLNARFTIPNIPSKTLDYFNVGIPVLASIDSSTDYGDLLEEANAGVWSIAGDHRAFKQNFDRLYNDENLRRKLGANGRSYFLKYLLPEIAYETIIKRVVS
jgi:glycosyltransferase involved in cell wall biosynthesis